MTSRLGRSVLFAAAFLTLAPGARAEERVPVDDVARYLAGHDLPSTSPLKASTENPGWRNAAAAFNAAWAGLERFQLPKLRAWSATHLKGYRESVFYMFSGPDFMYANAFFPNAATHVLSGLEPVGTIPDILSLSQTARERALACFRAPIQHFQNYGVYVTEELRFANETCDFKGNLPLLLVALARTGRQIREVRFVDLTPQGLPTTSFSKTPAGVEIRVQNGPALQTLYYFSVDLSNNGTSYRAFFDFCTTLGDGASLLKAASYLMHENSFSAVRDFVLQHSSAIVQDDSGVPLKYFNREDWQLVPFGTYRTPVAPFSQYDQPDLRILFRDAHARRLDFGLGYNWRANEANLLLGTRKQR